MYLIFLRESTFDCSFMPVLNRLIFLFVKFSISVSYSSVQLFIRHTALRNHKPAWGWFCSRITFRLCQGILKVFYEVWMALSHLLNIDFMSSVIPIVWIFYDMFWPQYRRRNWFWAKNIAYNLNNSVNGNYQQMIRWKGNKNIAWLRKFCLIIHFVMVTYNKTFYTCIRLKL